MIHSPSNSIRHYAAILAAVLFVVSLATLSANAQSGRRLPNSKPIAPPTPEPTPTPAAVKEKPKAISVLVGIDSDSFLGIPLHYYSVALDACGERIEASTAVEVAGRQLHMTRGEAIRRAKAEKESYIVWLQLRGDSLDADRSVHNLGEIILEYVLLAPVTAKQVTAGRTYQSAVRKGGVVISPRSGGRTNDVYGQYLIREAARDAGERILSALHVPTGRTVPP